MGDNAEVIRSREGLIGGSPFADILETKTLKIFTKHRESKINILVLGVVHKWRHAILDNFRPPAR